MRWSHGVDCDLFRPRAASIFEFPRPIFLTCARVAIEKNLDAFLSLDLPGSKVVVGDGPARRKLQTRFPAAHFVGEMRDERLAAAYASADVFVFPSLTDTFGLVLLEALASGLPVAANPVVGPLDVIGDSGAGVLDAESRSSCARSSLNSQRACACACPYFQPQRVRAAICRQRVCRALVRRNGDISSAVRSPRHRLRTSRPGSNYGSLASWRRIASMIRSCSSTIAGGEDPCRYRAADEILLR